MLYTAPRPDTRTGNDTYGFNAHFSGTTPIRWAYNFNDGRNPNPLVTIYDNGGNDTLDASQFYNSESGSTRPVHIDLRPSDAATHDIHPSYLMDNNQAFAVIYTTTWIENAVGSTDADQLIGNRQDNILTGNAGDDLLQGLEGNDTLLGGAGTDTMVLAGPRAAYIITQDANQTLTIVGTGSGAVDGTDTGVSIEQFQFAGSSLYTLNQILADDFAGSTAAFRDSRSTMR